METFSALLALCAGNSLVTGEFPSQRPVTRIFNVFFDLHQNKRLSKQWWGWWLETPSRQLWRHCNVDTGRRHHYSKFVVSGNVADKFGDDFIEICQTRWRHQMETFPALLAD